MNVLTEFLPGARQVRTPLAVGYLWLFVAWINAPRIPSKYRHSLVVIRANRDIHRLTPLLAVLIVSFCAYLIGVFFEIVDDVVLKGAAVTTALIMFVLAAITGGLFIIALWPVTLPIAFLVSVLVYLQARRYRANLNAAMKQLRINTTVLISSFVYTVWNLASRAWSPANPVKNDLIAEKADQLLVDHPDLIKRFCETLDFHSLREACREAGLKFGDTRSTYKTADGHMIGMSRVAMRSSIDPGSENLLRDYLYTRLTVSRSARRAVALRVINTSDIRTLVNKALNDIIARLQANMPAAFEVYDRLKSEGEFRRGVAVPLGAALCSACSLYTSNRLAIAAAGLPLLFVYFSGMRKQEESARIVVGWINAGIADIKLEVTNPNLLHWPTKTIKKSSLASRLPTYMRIRRSSQISAADEPEQTQDSTETSPPKGVELPSVT